MWDLWWTKWPQCHFVVDKVALGQVIPEHFGLITPNASHSSASSINVRGWYKRPVMALVIVYLVPLHTPLKKRPLDLMAVINQNVFDDTVSMQLQYHRMIIPKSAWRG
jgi:hypothetical protein